MVRSFLIRSMRCLFLVGVLLAVVSVVAGKEPAADRKLNIDPALRKALLRALRHLKERQEEEKQEQLLGDVNTTEENFATTILDELLEESTVADGGVDGRAGGDFRPYAQPDTIEGEVEQRETGAVTVGSPDANEIIKTIIIAKPKTTLSTPKQDAENEIVPLVEEPPAPTTTVAPPPPTPPSTTTVSVPVSTTPAPTHNEDGENIEQVKSEDVKIFQAPLVAAFTVQQDQLGVPRNVIPLLQTPPKQKPPSPATNAPPAPAPIPVESPVSLSTRALEEKTRLLEQQLIALQNQQRAQEQLLRAKIQQEQAIIQQQQQQLQQQKQRLEEETRLRIQRFEQEQRLFRQQQQQLFQQQFQQQQPPSTQQLPPFKPQQQPLQPPLAPQPTFVQELPRPGPAVQFIPSVSLPGGKPIPISVELQLPFKEAVDFQPQPPQGPPPKTTTSIEQVKAISQPPPPPPPQLTREQALPLKPFQPFNLFPVLPPLLLGPSPFDQQQLPPLQQRNRVFRQEPNTGNFGLNVGPQQQQQQAPFRPSQPLGPSATDSQSLQNLLLQSGITSRSAEDFNIITKVLALNHGIPQASSQRMFAKLSPDQQRQLLFRNTDRARSVDRYRAAPDTERPVLAKLTPDDRRQDLLDALARFSYFERWSDEQRRDCCHRAQLRRYPPDQTVFVEGEAPVNYAHFVLSGECGLLQCLKLHRRRDRRTGAKRYRLSPAQPTEDEITRFHRRRHRHQQPFASSPLELPDAGRKPANQRHECHFVDIATYSRGSVFGIGEHMVDRAVFARTAVECLLIPRYWLLEKPQNRGNIWNRVRIFLEQRQPSRERLFRWFLGELLWHRYRRQLVDDFRLVHAPRHLPRLNDVPLVCRIAECDD
uniref:Cyclic nucleotide-binding domain-containing protein n=1 Tax=Anopheles farauti TaxID=69004 RepID=A0A182QNU0_9DIPT